MPSVCPLGKPSPELRLLGWWLQGGVGLRWSLGLTTALKGEGPGEGAMGLPGGPTVLH